MHLAKESATISLPENEEDHHEKLFAIILACALLLSACGTAPVRVRDFDDDEDDDKGDFHFSGSRVETAIATVAPQITVNFRHYFENGSEYGAIRGLDSNGNQVWVVTTALLPTAQMDRVTSIGQYLDRYYYIEDGDVVAIRVSDGAELWRNKDFGGSPTDSCIVIGEDGTVYLSGFFGPDLFVADINGKTLLKERQISADYYWPCRLEIDTDAHKATVYMSGGPEGDMGSADAVPLEVDLP